MATITAHTMAQDATSIIDTHTQRDEGIRAAHRFWTDKDPDWSLRRSLAREVGIGQPRGRVETWRGNCHGASLSLANQLANAGIFSRVARGTATGVRGQHSWLVVGPDCYDEKALILDGTLNTYADLDAEVWVGTLAYLLHTPHGSGTMFDGGMPTSGNGAEITLGISEQTDSFLRHFTSGPRDLQWWDGVVHLPVGGWPAAEVISAAYDNHEIRPRIPIDLVGMLTTKIDGYFHPAFLNQTI